MICTKILNPFFKYLSLLQNFRFVCVRVLPTQMSEANHPVSASDIYEAYWTRRDVFASKFENQWIYFHLSWSPDTEQGHTSVEELVEHIDDSLLGKGCLVQVGRESPQVHYWSRIAAIRRAKKDLPWLVYRCNDPVEQLQWFASENDAIAAVDLTKQSTFYIVSPGDEFRLPSTTEEFHSQATAFT